MESLRGTAAFSVAILVLLFASLPQAQGTPPATPLTLITRDARRPVPTTVVNGQELIALDDVASLFQVSVGEDSLTSGLTVTYKGRTIVISRAQPMASVNGRIITLPATPVRAGQRWFVPLDFIPRALGPIYDQRIDLRRGSRLLIVGDVRVPRVTARIDAPGPPTHATVEIAPPATVTTTIDANRVVLRIDADALDLSLPAAGGGLIEQFRAGDQPNTVAIVLAPSGMARTTQSGDATATRIALDVPQAGAPPQDSSARPAPSAQAPAPAPVPAAPGTGVQTIVIDPGHGGEDTGAHGAGGLMEKDLTLDVAHRLRMLIEARLGIRVVLTRDADQSVPLDQRAAIANNNKANLFVSLHANAALSPMVSGAEVYHVRLDRELEQVRREAEEGAVALPVLGGGTRTLDVIRWDLAQAQHVDASARLAAILGETLAAGRVPMSPRAVQQAPLRVLEGANMPAALVEMAYLTNPDQEKLAQGDDFRNAVAQAVFDAIVRFRSDAGEARTQ